MRVVDRSEESCRSWQLVKFPSQPVTFIKIIGTHNTANEVRHVMDYLSKLDGPVQIAQLPLL